MSDTNTALPFPLQLARLCAWRPLDTEAREQQLAELAGQPQDLDANWRYLQDHRLWGVAAEALGERWGTHFLGSHWQTLQQRARQQKLSLLKLAAMQQRLEQAFSQAQLGLRVLKGPGLSQRLYGDTTIRHSKDLDLLVPVNQLWQACELLQQQGFVLQDAPTLQTENRRLIARHYWHLTLLHPQHQVLVELHWRFEPVQAPSRERLWPEQFAVNRIDEAEFLYLIHHGSRHHWFRLKWLGDILAISERQPNLWQSCQPLAATLGLQDALAQAVHLIQWLWPEQMTAAMQAIRQQSRTGAQFMADEARHYLLAHDYPELKGKLLVSDRLRGYRYQWQLNARYRPRERWLNLRDRLMYAPCDIEQLQLPAHRHWCYPLLRLPLLARRWWIARTDLNAVRHG
jgi:hypothetical protein